MANIALVTLDATHSAPVTTRNMLVTLGHTVTIITSASATAMVLLTYDLIVWCRGSENATHITAIKNAFDLGVPIISGFSGGAINNYNLPVQALRFTSQSPLVTNITGDNSQDSFVKIIEHPINAGISVVGGVVKVYNSSSFMIALAASNIVSSAQLLATRVGDSGRISMMMVSKGALNLDGEPTPAHFAHFDWLYGSGGYTADAIEMINRTIDMFVGGTKFVSGTVTDTNGDPAVRKIYAVNLINDRVESTTMSASDGTYSFSLRESIDYAIFTTDPIAAPLIYVG